MLVTLLCNTSVRGYIVLSFLSTIFIRNSNHSGYVSYVIDEYGSNFIPSWNPQEKTSVLSKGVNALTVQTSMQLSGMSASRGY